MPIGGIQSTASSELYELVQSYMESERQPLTRLQTNRTQLTQRVSGLSTLKSKLQTLRSAIDDFRWPGSLTPVNQFTAQSSDAQQLTATAAAGASEGSHTVIVGARAQAHALAGSEVTAADSFAGSGAYSFTLTQGGDSYTISVDLAAGLTQGDVLEQVATAIEASGADVGAAVVNSNPLEGGQRLLLTSRTTGSQALIAEIADVDGDLAAQLGLTGSSVVGGFSANTVQEAADAAFSVDGLAFVSGTNQIADVLPGLSFELLSDEGTPVTVTVARDAEAVRGRVEEFIEAYNGLIDFVRQETRAANAEGENRGRFTGDALFMTLRSDLQTLATRAVDDLAGGEALDRLSQIGISVDAAGRLALSDQTAFDEALATRPDEVVALFGADEDGVAERIVAHVDNYASSDGWITRQRTALDSRARLLDSSIARLEERLARREETLLNQFASLQATITSLVQQQNQLSSITGLGTSF